MPNIAAQTAYGPMMLVAAEQYYPRERRVVQDELAYQFLPSGSQLAARLARWTPIRSLVFNISERRARGVWASVLCRKRYIDDKLSESASGAAEALVNLGAGLDTHAYRPPVKEAIRAFEVDLPENIAYKKDKVKELYGAVPENVAFVPVDFDREDLMSCLAGKGFPAGCKGFFIWESVTQYLHEAGVRKTMDFLSKAGRGSRLVFTYILGDFIDGANLYGLNALYAAYRGGNPIWHFGLEPGSVPQFLEEYGWKASEQVGGREYADRYLKPIGRDMPVMEIERAVLAEKM
jgi:methyltransferase (TIGR00027 family)